MKPLGSLFWTFFQIGLFSIGGGYAIIPLIQEQVVEVHAWISRRTFTDIISISQMTPGPLAVNTSTFVGMQIHGLPGAVIATVGTVSAGIAIAVVLYYLVQKYKGSVYVLQVLNGLKAASLGLIMSAAATIMLLMLAGTATLPLTADVDWVSLVVFAGALFALRKWKVNPIFVMVLTGAIGAVVGGA